MNICNLSGEVLRHGIKGGNFPKLWVHIALPSPRESGINDNKVFINFDLDANTQSSNGKIGEFIKNKITTHSKVFILEAFVASIQSSKKNDDGTWANENITGVKGKIRNINLSKDAYPIINNSTISGNVSRYSYNQETGEEKFIVEDKYRNVRTNEWLAREVPVFRKGVSAPVNLMSRSVFVDGTLCGTTLNGESKTYIWANKLIVTG